jgi:hypothetical protein
MSGSSGGDLVRTAQPPVAPKTPANIEPVRPQIQKICHLSTRGTCRIISRLSLPFLTSLFLFLSRRPLIRISLCHVTCSEEQGHNEVATLPAHTPRQQKLSGLRRLIGLT